MAMTSAEIQYQVKQGETLSNIAKAHGVTSQDIINHTKKYHHYTIESDVREGEIIYIPEIKRNVIAKDNTEQATTSPVAMSEPSTIEPKTPVKDSTRNVGQCIGDSECTAEWVDLLHINYPAENGTFNSQFIPLTASEQKACIQEEEYITKKIHDFYEGSKKINQQRLKDISINKRKLFEELNATTDEYGDIFMGHEGQSNLSQLYEVRRFSKEKHTYSYLRIKFFKANIDITKAYDIPTLDDVMRMEKPWIRPSTQEEITADTINRSTPKKDTQDAQDKKKETSTALNYQVKSNILEAIASRAKGGKGGKPSPALERSVSSSAKKVFFEDSMMEWKTKPNKSWDIGGKSIKVDAQAQVFRIAADASSEFSYDLAKKEVTIGGKISGEVDLINASSKFKIQWPERDEDSHFTIDYYLKEEAGCTSCKVIEDNGNEKLVSTQSLDCGYFKVEAEGELKGKIGASLILGANIKAKMQNGIPIIKGFDSAGKDSPSAELKLFAGFEGGVALNGCLRWCDDLTEAEGEWKDLAKLGVSAEIDFGVGIVGNFKVMNKDGKYAIRKNAKAIWGPHCDGSIDCEIDFDNIAAFYRFLYRNLMEVDYQRMEFIEDDAFSYWVSNIVYYAAMAAEHGTLISTSPFYKKIITNWASYWHSKEYSQMELMAGHIYIDLGVPQMSEILYSPPEAKGILINAFLSKGLWTRTMQNAVSRLVTSAQTSRELELIFACTNESGRLSKDLTKRRADINRNITRIGKYLYGGEHDLFTLQFKNIEENAKKKTAIKARQVKKDALISDAQLKTAGFVNPAISSYAFHPNKIFDNSRIS